MRNLITCRSEYYFQTFPSYHKFLHNHIINLYIRNYIFSTDCCFKMSLEINLTAGKDSFMHCNTNMLINKWWYWHCICTCLQEWSCFWNLWTGLSMLLIMIPKSKWVKNVSFDVLDMIFWKFTFGNIHWQLLFSNLEGTFVLSLELWSFIFLRSSATADLSFSSN